MAASLSSSMDSFRAAELRCCGCQVLMEVKKERINRLLKSSRGERTGLLLDQDAFEGGGKRNPPLSYVVPVAMEANLLHQCLYKETHFFILY